MMKVVVLASDLWLNSLVIHFTGAIDVLPQTFIKIVLRTTLGNLLLIVKLDLRYEQPRKTPGIVVEPTFLFIIHTHRQLQIHAISTPGSQRRSTWSRWTLRKRIQSSWFRPNETGLFLHRLGP